jgi:hypothetical protein
MFIGRFALGMGAKKVRALGLVGGPPPAAQTRLRGVTK